MITEAGKDLSSAHCRNCDYSLNGLVNFTCPECGTPFDPCDDTTMITKALPSAACWVLRPAGRVWWTAVLSATLLSLWAGRVSSFDAAAGLAATAAWVLVFVSWYARTKLRQYVNWLYWKQARGRRHSNDRCWVSLVAFGCVALLVYSGVVWKVFFYVHEPAVTNLAARMMKMPPGTTVYIGRVGLYSECEATRERTYVHIGLYGSGPDAAGVYYSEGLDRPPGDVRHMWGPWYEWSY